MYRILLAYLIAECLTSIILDVKCVKKSKVKKVERSKNKPFLLLFLYPEFFMLQWSKIFGNQHC